VAAVLIFALRGRHHEFATATSRATPSVLAIAVVAQIVALLARSEAWHLSIREAGGRVGRRVLYRASSVQVLGSVLNGQLGVAARIAALRRSSGAGRCPQVSTLIAAEFPILAVEAVLAGLASFTLIGPLGLPWWSPALGIAVVAAAAAGLRRLALRTGHAIWRGLAVLRSQRHGGRMVAFVVVAILSQVARNWLLLNAVGMHASLFDAVAVLIAVVALAQLPVGPSVGAAAAVLILGTHGVAGAAAAGVLMTVTGTVGGMCFALWAGVDRFVGNARRLRGRANVQRVVVLEPAPALTRRDL
jgi:Lysylphosphatidylglycerol synthase TM region